MAGPVQQAATGLKPAIQQGTGLKPAQPKSPTYKYRILGGKHIRKGKIMGVKDDIIELTEEEANKFQNRFQRVDEEGEGIETEKGKK